MSGFESIVYEVENGRARITLNRPEKLNALTLKLMKELRTRPSGRRTTTRTCTA